MKATYRFPKLVKLVERLSAGRTFRALLFLCSRRAGSLSRFAGWFRRRLKLREKQLSFALL